MAQEGVADGRSVNVSVAAYFGRSFSYAPDRARSLPDSHIFISLQESQFSSQTISFFYSAASLRRESHVFSGFNNPAAPPPPSQIIYLQETPSIIGTALTFTSPLCFRKPRRVVRTSTSFDTGITLYCISWEGAGNCCSNCPQTSFDYASIL